ncbi:unnamed protein product [Bursaphelenchus okinawaensis]|uniref:BTB domain-containing protein n=1 Tax=Bursaphelenchus okinawaensis TaxID=465554 RepID=A0A811KBR1_9BILA|nr:unnamed protein product [Bursaphelenchus okinawaensis]CAG9097722.1 unnamed protein product [Bursaphelenchus okinawaensis]
MKEVRYRGVVDTLCSVGQGFKSCSLYSGGNEKWDTTVLNEPFHNNAFPEAGNWRRGDARQPEAGNWRHRDARQRRWGEVQPQMEENFLQEREAIRRAEFNRERTQITKRVPLTVTQRENVEMELQVDAFKDSPQFTTTLLIEYNRGYKRIGFKIQPISPAWQKVHVRIASVRDSRFDSRNPLSNNMLRMEKVDNGEALYAAVSVPGSLECGVEFLFSTERNEAENGEGRRSNRNQPENKFQASKMFMDEKYSDFTFVCEYEGEETIRIPVHKVIVGPSSPYFQGMFFGQHEESANGEAVVNTFKPNIVKEIFYYIYNNKISDEAYSNCSEIVKAADYFQLDGLRDHCLAEVGKNINRNNVLDLICLAGQFGGVDISSKAKKYVDTYMTKDDIKELYTNLIHNNPEAAIHFFTST